MQKETKGQEKGSCLSAQKGQCYSAMTSTILSTGNVESKKCGSYFYFSFTLGSGSLNCQDVSQKRELDTRSDLLKPVSHVALHLTGHSDFSYLRLSQKQKYQVLAVRMEESEQGLESQAEKDLPTSFRTHEHLENVNYLPEPQFPHMWDGFEEPTCYGN